MNILELVPSLVSLRTNVDRIHHCPLVSVDIPTSRGDRDVSCDLFEVEFLVEGLESPHRDHRDKLFQRRSNSELYFERPLGFGRIAKLLIDFDISNPRIIVNPSYHSIMRMTFDNLYAPGWHLRDLVQITLLANRYTLLHSAALTNGHSGIVLVGLPNTGKTTTTLDLVRNHGWKFVGEDITVTNGTCVHSCPYNVSPINPAVTGNLHHRLHERVRKTFPLLNRFVRRPLRSITDVVEESQIEHSMNVDYVFVLSKGSPGVRPISSEQASSKIEASNRSEFSYCTNEVLLGGQYNELVDISGLRAAETNIIKNLSESARTFELTGQPDYFSEVVRETVMGGSRRRK